MRGCERKVLAILTLVLALCLQVSAATQAITLQEGWNTVSFDISGLSFEDDIRDQCDFNWYENDDYYVWTQSGGGWTHPDQLSTGRGYTFNADSQCTIEVTGPLDKPNMVTLYDGWNLVNLPQGLSAGDVVSQCGIDNLRWYNSRLDEVDETQIQESERYYFWINKGNSWENPYWTSAAIDEGEAVYINSEGSCTLTSSSGEDQDGEDSSIFTGGWEFGHGNEQQSNVESNSIGSDGIDLDVDNSPNCGNGAYFEKTMNPVEDKVIDLRDFQFEYQNWHGKVGMKLDGEWEQSYTVGSLGSGEIDPDSGAPEEGELPQITVPASGGEHTVRITYTSDIQACGDQHSVHMTSSSVEESIPEGDGSSIEEQ